MTTFRMDVHRKSGAVTIWLETLYGPKPIMGWADLEGVREFAEMLLDFYSSRKEEKDKIKRVSDALLKQALGDEKYFEKETF